MLDILRRQASSWLIKSLLLLIVLTFALFFGYNQIESQRAARQRLAALVGNQVIPRQRVDLIVENNLRQIRSQGAEPHQAEVPENLENFLRQSILQQLVSQELSSLFAESLGLNVTEAEVARAIREDPNLQQQGKFDEIYYLQQFRPNFRRQYGEDYETTVKKQLAVESLEKLTTLSFDPWLTTLKETSKEAVLSPRSLMNPWIEFFREKTEIEIY